MHAAGTTALWDYLARHKRMRAGYQLSLGTSLHTQGKEPQFFMMPKIYFQACVMR